MRAQSLVPAHSAIDHLLLGTNDLDRGIEWFERLSVVKAAIGGVHPGRGTRNALVAFKGRQYLEIIAPDPAQPPENLTMNLRGLTTPRLITWAAAATDLESVATRARSGGVTVSAPRDGSRARPDGRVLKWRTVGVSATLARDDVDPIPFFIEWARESAHPAQDSPGGCTLVAFEFEHPDAPILRKTLEALGIAATVRQAATAKLTATIDTPKGRVTLS
jgi:hypothetical protein